MFDDHTTDGGLFELLGSSRRRLLLYHLQERDGAAPLVELSREIAAHETDADPEAVDRDETMRVYVSLYQNHVPALEERDVVEYDDDDRVVRLDRRAHELAALLRDPWTARRRYATYYAAAAVTLLVIALARATRLAPVPESALAALTVGAAAVPLLVGIVHYYRYREPSSGVPSLDPLAP